MSKIMSKEMAAEKTVCSLIHALIKGHLTAVKPVVTTMKSRTATY
jgi:hypothetical protein